jgi:hypothetical protein
MCPEMDGLNPFSGPIFNPLSPFSYAEKGFSYIRSTLFGVNSIVQLSDEHGVELENDRKTIVLCSHE